MDGDRPRINEMRRGLAAAAGRWIGHRICRTVALAVALAAGPVGCALEQRPDATGLSLRITAPILVPPGRAHATFQDGRLVSASSELEPYCELEVRDVSGTSAQRLTGGTLEVTGIGSRVLRDPTTYIPAMPMMTSCSDPLFQELVWQLRSDEASEVMFLRCIAPYYNCAFGPPLSPHQVQRQLGRYLAVSSVPTGVGYGPHGGP